LTIEDVSPKSLKLEAGEGGRSIAERPGRMKTNVNTAILTTLEHRQFIEDLKARVATARISAARAVNRDLILLYWDIGRAIVEKQQTLGWGESVIDRVSRRKGVSP
jgi:hypothetical protein